MSAANNLIPTTKLNDLQTIDTNTYTVLKETLYPGAKDESIAMVLSYCEARKLDPIKKPVHLVPMSVKTGKKDGQGKDIYEYRDVVMPGIGLYRIEADRSGQYAGMTEPEFGEEITEQIGSLKVTYPKWCKITVKKYVGDRIVDFTAKEFWKENYATKSRSDQTPNAMWEKRGYGQLAKCTEAQALRKAFPDVVGQDYTKEEMEGKSFPNHHHDEPKKLLTFEGETVNNADEPSVEEMLKALSLSTTSDELAKVFKGFYKILTKNKDQDSLKKLIDHKDRLKAEMEYAEAECASAKSDAQEAKVDTETGEVK